MATHVLYVIVLWFQEGEDDEEEDEEGEGAAKKDEL